MFSIRSDRCKHCSDMKLIINLLSFPPCSALVLFQDSQAKRSGNKTNTKENLYHLVSFPDPRTCGEGLGTRLYTTMGHVMERYVPNGGSLVTHIRVVLDCFQALYASQQEEVVSRGCPRVLISEEQLQFYVEHGLTLHVWVFKADS